MNVNSKFYAQFADYYESVYADVDAAEAVRQWRSLLGLDSKLMPFSPSLLDLGCGPGWHLQPWQQAGFRVCGLDLSPEMLRRAARLNSKVPLYCGDILDPDSLASLNEQFSFVVAHFNFLNLFPPICLPTVFASVVRLLEKGGVWITDFTYRADNVPPQPHRQELLYGTNEIRVSWKLGNICLEEQYWLHSPESVVEAAQTAGFTCVNIHGWKPERINNPWCSVSENGRVIVAAVR